MNRHYFRLIFSRCLNMLVPVAELLTCRARGQTANDLSSSASQVYSTADSSQSSSLLTRSALPYLLVIGILTSSSVNANPLNPNVIHGSASFQQQGDLLSITNSAGAIIEWQEFSIAPHEITRFLQPHTDSTVLNRITGQSPSEILGQLQSNGHVWLINPNGVLFGADSQIDVAGLLASTLDISNHDFINGIGHFEGAEGVGNIRHDGLIQTPTGGQVILIAPQVENHGVIISPEGQILLAAGHKVELADLSNPALRVEITAEGEALNIGQLIAESGQIGIHAGLVRQSGEVNASSAVMEGGRIFLRGMQETHVSGDAVMSATGTVGGQIDILGHHVAVYDQAVVDVSGETDAGQIRVGGDYLGQNPEVMNAEVTFVGENAQLLANAGEIGDGGRIIVWSDDTTRVHGTIQARGGELGGDGGFIETSGKEHLTVTRAADASAPMGNAGVWLLDPNDILITESADNNISSGPDFTTTGDSAILPPSLIVAALNDGTNVTITTGSAGDDDEEGNIRIQSDIIKSAGGNATLTLNAHGNVIASNRIQSTEEQLNIIITAGGAIDFDDVELISNGGNIILTAQSGRADLTGSTTLLSGGGNIEVTAQTGIETGDVINAVGGHVILHNLGAGNEGDIEVLGDITGATLLFRNDADNSNNEGLITATGTITGTTGVAFIAQNTIDATNVISPLLAAESTQQITITRATGDLTLGNVELPGGGTLGGLKSPQGVLITSTNGNILFGPGTVVLDVDGGSLNASSIGSVIIDDGTLVDVILPADADPLLVINGVLENSGTLRISGASVLLDTATTTGNPHVNNGLIQLNAGTFVNLSLNTSSVMALENGSTLRLGDDSDISHNVILWRGGTIEGTGSFNILSGGEGFVLAGDEDSERIFNGPMSLILHTESDEMYLLGTLTINDGSISISDDFNSELIIGDGPGNAGRLVLTESDSLVAGMQIRVKDNGTLELLADGNSLQLDLAANDLVIEGGELLLNTSTGFSAGIESALGGQIRFAGGAGGGTLTKTGQGSSIIEVPVALVNDNNSVVVQQGTLAITAGGSNQGNGNQFLLQNDGILSMTGPTFSFQSDTEFNLAANAEFDSSAILAVGSAELLFNGNGTITLSNDITALTTDASVINQFNTIVIANNLLIEPEFDHAGQLQSLSGAETLTLGSNMSTTGSIDSVNLDLGGNTLTMLAGSVISGDMSISGDGVLDQQAGTLSPGGNNIGTITILGTWQVGSNALVLMQFDGNNHDQVMLLDVVPVSSVANFAAGATIRVDLIDPDAQPAAGDYTLIQGTTTGVVPQLDGASGAVGTLKFGSLIFTAGTPVTPPTIPPTTPPTTPPAPGPGQPPVIPEPEPEPEPTPPLVPVSPGPSGPEQRLIEHILLLVQQGALRFSDNLIEVRNPLPQDGEIPWNSQFEETDRPNVCRLMCY